MSHFTVERAGMLALIIDAGRYGYHNLGLTTSGPLDSLAFYWANRLLDNQQNLTSIELSYGGLKLTASANTRVAITGAVAPCKLNGEPIEQWRTHNVNEGDQLEIGYCTQGTRCYLAVAGGFSIEPSFGSTSTVLREKIGGLNGGQLQPGDNLPCHESPPQGHQRLAEKDRPEYPNQQLLRVIQGYQHHSFAYEQQHRFYHSDYQLSDHCDRMGFRLQGPPVKSKLTRLLSEGICQGAIQVPADGQPIVLMNDRPTIGGYPKLGSVIPQDTARLSQLRPGATVGFHAISLEQAYNLHQLQQKKLSNTGLQRL